MIQLKQRTFKWFIELPGNVRRKRNFQAGAAHQLTICYGDFEEV
jgi:hypothetical protein